MAKLAVNEANSAIPTGEWHGKWNRAIPVSFRFTVETGNQLSFVVDRKAYEPWGVTAKIVEVEATVVSTNPYVFTWTDTSEGYDQNFRFTYLPDESFVLGELSAPRFETSIILRREGDVRRYLPKITPLVIPEQARLKDLPSSKRWLSHVEKELAPFWMSDDAKGRPFGLFPSYRCNNGTVYSADKNPCPELTQSDFLKSGIGLTFVRLISRQTYAYGVLFHLTGDPQALKNAKAGVDYLIEHAIDSESGAVVNSWKDGVADSDVMARTSQDLAYAQMGMAFYYYLTRDKDVLKEILRVKKYVFDNYYDTDLELMRWLPKGAVPQGQTKKELIAQLDQINAYLMLLSPVLPSPEKIQWNNDLMSLASAIRGQFYDAELNRFWGSIDNESGKEVTASGADFGHIAKTFWMFYTLGSRTNQQDWINFGLKGMQETLSYAYLPAENGKHASWSYGVNALGKQSKHKEWWTFAELDQAAAVYATVDNSSINYLAETYWFWLKEFVDHDEHEVWASVNRYGEPFKVKTHLWKSGFHSMEHALIAYISTRHLEGKTVPLYFARAEKKDKVFVPYYFSGLVTKQKIVGSLNNLNITRVHFAINTSLATE